MSSVELTNEIQKDHQNLEKRGCRPNHHLLDNEGSQKLLDMLQDRHTTICLVLPHCRRKKQPKEQL